MLKMNWIVIVSLCVQLVSSGAAISPICNIGMYPLQNLAYKRDQLNIDALDTFMTQNTGCMYRTVCSTEPNLFTSAYYTGRYEQIFGIRSKVFLNQIELQWSIFDKYSFDIQYRPVAGESFIYQNKLDEVVTLEARHSLGNLSIDGYVFFFIRIENKTLTFGSLCDPNPVLINDVTIEIGDHVELSMKTLTAKLLYDCPRNGKGTGSGVPAHRGFAEWQLVKFVIDGPFELECIRDCDDRLYERNYTWLINGTRLVATSSYRHHVTQDRHMLQVNKATEKDNGEYICLAEGVVARRFRLEAVPQFFIQLLTEKIEVGEKVTIVCNVRGRPYPTVKWTYRRHHDDKEIDVAEAFRGRALVKTSGAGVPGALFTLQNFSSSDDGYYSCHIRDYFETTRVSYSEVASGSESRVMKNAALMIMMVSIVLSIIY